MTEETQDPPFVIEGPDADGVVWIRFGDGIDGRRPLGRPEQAAEAMSQWLGSIDYQENV